LESDNPPGATVNAKRVMTQAIPRSVLPRLGWHLLVLRLVHVKSKRENPAANQPTGLINVPGDDRQDCARRGCRRNERDPQACRDPGRRRLKDSALPLEFQFAFHIEIQGSQARVGSSTDYL